MSDHLHTSQFGRGMARELLVESLRITIPHVHTRHPLHLDKECQLKI